jgi:GT2 family glycosyltransferase
MIESLPKVSIIIPCHNGWTYTNECLKSIYNSSYKNYNVIVINDGSNDETSFCLYKQFPKVKEVLGDGNLWWAESMNLGFNCALSYNSDFVLILNNDVILEENTIKNLVDTALNFPNSIIGSLVYNLQNKKQIWSAGGIMKWPWPGEFQLGISEIDSTKYKGIWEVDWTPGMGTLISTSILIELNSYDSKNMPQYLADVDLCLRAKKKGISILINSECVLYNNIYNTGGVSLDSFNFNSIKDIFLSYRSPEFFKARISFIFRHCKWHLVFFAILIRYCRLLFYIFKRLH